MKIVNCITPENVFYNSAPLSAFMSIIFILLDKIGGFCRIVVEIIGK